MRENQKVIETILMLVGYRQEEITEHSRRVSAYTRLLLSGAEEVFPEVSLTEERKNCIAVCALLHDLGKGALCDCGLLQKRKPSEKEKEYYYTHTVRGEEMAETLSLLLDADYVECLKDICRYHHERYDGRGYPDGLLGEEIPFAAQVVGIADAFDELVSERFYKHAYSCNDAIGKIVHGERGIFSSRLIGCFLRKKEELIQIVTEWESLS